MSDPQTGETQRNPRQPSENGRQTKGPKSLSEKLLSPMGGKTSVIREWMLCCRDPPPIGGHWGGHTWKMLKRCHLPALPVGLEDPWAVPKLDTAPDATDPLRSWELIPRGKIRWAGNLPAAAHGCFTCRSRDQPPGPTGNTGTDTAGQ